MPRPPRIHHPTSEPWRFFGRHQEQRILNDALANGHPSVVAFSGPGGQGKTAIVQHWLHSLGSATPTPDGIFLWSFYRGKDADLCLRSLYAYAYGLDRFPEVSSSYCVDHLLPLLRNERWAIVFDGTEVAQFDTGPWQGRFLHPELGRLLEELASQPTPGVLVLTTRFSLPTLTLRPHIRLVSLDTLDPASSTGLLSSLGVKGTPDQLDAVAKAAGYHAKAVELLGTYLVRYHHAAASALTGLPDEKPLPDASAEENQVARVLLLQRQALPLDLQDIVALTTAFHAPLDVASLHQYLVSPAVRILLHDHWGRTYPPFAIRLPDWFNSSLQILLDLRLLESVHPGPVIDAHPLVRRGFEQVLGPTGQRQSALARAGFLRGRPDRNRPDRLEDAGAEIELFHSFCDAHLWAEADSAYRALENPKHRLLAPTLERDLLLRFFPEGDLTRPPLWAGFARYRSLAISLEMLGDFETALQAYRDADAPLRGDALLALGQTQLLLDQPRAPHPWNNLWQAYRCHALALAGRTEEAIALARSLFPVDVYEWFHVFEALWHTRRLDLIDPRSLTAPHGGGEHRWSDLARRRMRADQRQILEPTADLDAEYQDLIEAYDRAGLPLERALTRVRYARWHWGRMAAADISSLLVTARALAVTHNMLPLLGEIDLIIAGYIRHQPG